MPSLDAISRWKLTEILYQIAPKAIRGRLTLQYAACQQLGVVFGFFINYGVTKTYSGSDKQW